MKILILCSSPMHPINPYLMDWIANHPKKEDIHLVRNVSDLKHGDLLILISCVEIISAKVRSRFKKTLVIHASGLPYGRGWSPHIWQLIEGKSDIPVTLLEAEDSVDTGDIWHQVICHIPHHLLWDEINALIFKAELDLIDFAITNFETCTPVKQNPNIEPSYFRKRTPADSEVNPDKSIAAQMDLIRVCDPNRFPAFFCYQGHRYEISIRKTSSD